MKFAILSLALFLLPALAIGYEADTHALMTSHAFDRSALAEESLNETLGIDRLNEGKENSRPFIVPPAIGYGGHENAYFDFRASKWEGPFTDPVRETQKFDFKNMISISGVDIREKGVGQHLPRGWLMRGVVREDDIPVEMYDGAYRPDADPHNEFIRVLHHFFDPVHNLPLDLGIDCGLLPGVLYTCSRSTDWAFGRTDIADATNPPIDPLRRNHFSWQDAREAMWCALTRNEGNPEPIDLADRNSTERRLCWASTLNALGHVVHLLQDSAQPQHVRNDPHNKSDTIPEQSFNASIERRTYEAWINFRALGAAKIDDEEDRGKEFRTFFGEKAKNPPTIAPGLSYPIPRFSEPQFYFTTRQVETAITPASLKKRRGLADFANRSFFSEGTILDDDFPLPPPDPESADYTVKQLAVTRRLGFGEIREEHLSAALADPLKGSYVDTSLAKFGNLVPLASVSLWKEYAPNDTSLQKGVVSLDEYSAHADVLIPRAIAYSAGLIDYFFRGKLEITPPLDGLFSVIDHGTPHTVNAKGYPIRSDDSKVFGFTKVRLRVRNATDVVNESGTNLPIPRDVMSTTASAAPLEGDPTLVAVARYHRNPCYKPDLSGERRIAYNDAVTEPAGCGNAGTRTSFQELSVSKPVASSAASLNGAGQDLVFDFGSQPIPVNATDLAIQVVYRGPLGLESDAIAVGSFDVREPTYITHWNNSDYAACSGGWFANGATPPGCIVEGVTAQRAILTTRVCIGTQLVFEHFDNPHGSLGTGKFVRLVALMDDKSKATRSRSIVHDLNTIQIRNRTIAGHLRQSAKEQVTVQAPFVSDPFWSKRGLVGSLRPLPYYQINGADPQPVNDAGPLDVGALANALDVATAPDSGNVLFPDVAMSNMTCTTTNAKAVFDDEVAYTTKRKTAAAH